MGVLVWPGTVNPGEVSVIFFIHVDCHAFLHVLLRGGGIWVFFFIDSFTQYSSIFLTMDVLPHPKCSLSQSCLFNP